LDNNIAFSDWEINILRNAAIALRWAQQIEDTGQDEPYAQFPDEDISAVMLKLDNALDHPQTVFE